MQQYKKDERWECRLAKCRYQNKPCEIRDKINAVDRDWGNKFLQVKLIGFDCPGYKPKEGVKLP